MSEQSLTPISNDLRYEISIENHLKQKSYVLYEIVILDLVFRNEHKLIIRFKELQKFHQKLMDLPAKLPIPELPKKNSFCFWNRTNDSSKKIAERKRQIQYYLQKLFNDPYLRGLKVVKNLLVVANNRKKSNSAIKRRKSLGFLEKQKLSRSLEVSSYGKKFV